MAFGLDTVIGVTGIADRQSSQTGAARDTPPTRLITASGGLRKMSRRRRHAAPGVRTTGSPTRNEECSSGRTCQRIGVGYRCSARKSRIDLGCTVIASPAEVSGGTPAWVGRRCRSRFFFPFGNARITAAGFAGGEAVRAVGAGQVETAEGVVSVVVEHLIGGVGGVVDVEAVVVERDVGRGEAVPDIGLDRIAVRGGRRVTAFGWVGSTATGVVGWPGLLGVGIGIRRDGPVPALGADLSVSIEIVQGDVLAFQGARVGTDSSPKRSNVGSPLPSPRLPNS